MVKVTKHDVIALLTNTTKEKLWATKRPPVVRFLPKETYHLITFFPHEKTAWHILQEQRLHKVSTGKDFAFQSAEPAQVELAMILAIWTLFFTAASQKKNVRPSNLPSQMLIHRQLQWETVWEECSLSTLSLPVWTQNPTTCLKQKATIRKGLGRALAIVQERSIGWLSRLKRRNRYQHFNNAYIWNIEDRRSLDDQRTFSTWLLAFALLGHLCSAWATGCWKGM